MIITGCAVIDHIDDMSNRASERYFKIYFQHGGYVFVEREKFMQRAWSLLGCFGNIPDLKEKICGKQVVYCMTADRQLRGLTPSETWKGPEMDEGDFLIDFCCCKVWG